MATEPDLTTRLSRAIKSCEVGWKPVDGELYDLCRRRPRHDDFADVYTKVAIIGRVYAAGIARSSKADGDREAAVANGLVGLGAVITDQLSEMVDGELDRSTLTQVLDLARPGLSVTPHAHRQHLAAVVRLQVPALPLPDRPDLRQQGRRSCRTLRRLADRLRSANSISRQRGWPIRYYNFATAFMVLFERAHGQAQCRNLANLNTPSWGIRGC